VAGQLVETNPDVLTLRTLRRISPSLGTALLACELSVAFRLDPQFRLFEPETPASALGTVSHELAEEVALGGFDAIATSDIQSALAEAWAAKLARVEERVNKAHPAGRVPPPRRWPGYEHTRVRTLALLEDEILNRKRRNSPDGGNLRLEVRLEPKGVPLHGRADRVETHRSGTEIVDLKTGWALPEELSPAHRRQLLAYAYLWHAVHGDWPTRASIQRLDGVRMTIEVDPTEAEEVAAELVRAVDAFNRRVASDPSRLALASPSPTSCRYCAYRPACRPFFRAVREAWGWYRASCLGTVTSTKSAREQLRVVLDVQEGNVRSRTISLINVPRELEPARGSTLAVVGALPTRLETDFRVAWNTTLCVWAAAPPSDGVLHRVP
jgi:hypothetical protein